MSEDLDRISLTLPPEMVDRLDDIADDWEYASRSEAIRDALRDFFVAHDWEAEDTARHYGSVVVVHDHDHDSDLPGRLQSIQHEMGDVVTSVQHVHLTEHQCMETIVVDGPAGEIQTMANRLRALEGVRQVKVVAAGGDRDRTAASDHGHEH